MPPAPPFTIMLTGFEPFGDPRPEKNPSWEAVKGLEGQEGPGYRVVGVMELAVTYEGMDRVRDQPLPDVDALIHVGQGRKGQVHLEKCARPWPYRRKDALGRTPQDHGREDKEVLESTIDVDALVDALSAWPNVAASEDAGLYVCEYTYYTSMERRELGPRPKVLFVHVPPDDPYYEADKTTELLTEICEAIARQ